MADASIGIELLVFGVAAAISIAIITAMMPLLARHALARPNARSSHRKPTPQGGGIAVIGATIVVVAGINIFAPQFLGDSVRLAGLLFSTVALAVIGATDDLRPIGPILRLLLQLVAVIIVVAALPADMRILPILPWWVERAALLVGMLWFVNLTNFMDGIDWMTVAEVIPVACGLVLAGTMGGLPHGAMIIALALLGATVGFAPFNKPVARLFLGDVGSLPIGLLLAWLLTLLASQGHLAAAVLLPLYYLFDTSITLVRRMAHNEPVLQAHRSHFYQRATDNGLTVVEIVMRVFIVNLVLVALALGTMISHGTLATIAALACGCIVVSLLLLSLSCGRSS
jgi:UDP-N-acetylmuramyl pentapeptide phosphotransferase/UDP-N-acetylglucosamine-1-phosphate transferase